MLRPRIAAPAKPDAPPHALQVLEGVNDECHTWRGRLDKHGGLVLSSPRVFAVYWDPFFADSANVARMDQFFRDIGKTVWFQGQRQFGVRPPLTLVGSVVIGTPAPTKMSRDQLKDFLVARLDDGTIGVKPAGRETSLLYVLITPGATELTLERPFKPPLSSLTDFSGYHDWDRYAISPVFTTENLFFAAIPMPSAPGLTFKLVADVLTPTLCHEMVESFTDRNGDGWKAPNGCEIGDVCEVQAADRLGHWRIERYWSDADQVCFPVVHFPPYRDFLLHTGTPIGAADGAANFHWAVGDFNGDGVPDLFGIKVSNTGTGTVEVHVLDGASGYQQFLLHTGTPVGAADGAANFVWGVGSFNGDGVADLFAIKVSSAASGTMEVHVLDGASGYQQFLLQKPTKVNQGEAQKLRMVVAPLNQGGIADVFALQVQGAPSGKLRVRVLDDLDDFQTPALEVGTPIDAADAAANFSWAVGDLDGDGVADLFGIKTSSTGTGTVEVHVLGGVGAARIPTSRVFPAGDPFGYAAQVPRVVYRGDDGHVYELAIYPETGGWGAFDMSGATGAPAAAGDPMGYLSNTARVVYRAGDGHVHEIWLGGNGWEHFDMTAATKAPAPAGNPMGYHLDTPRVVYRSGIRSVFELAIDGGSWRRLEL
jgi:hypothetical protein